MADALQEEQAVNFDEIYYCGGASERKQEKEEEKGEEGEEEEEAST